MKHFATLLFLSVFYTLSATAQASRSYAIRIEENDRITNMLSFVELERTEQDSFKYRLTLMDEHMSKAGKIEFHDRYLKPMSAASGGGLLCIAYLRSEKPRIRFMRDLRQKGEILFQFIDTNGTIISTLTLPVQVETRNLSTNLRNDLVMRYVKGAGFLYAYGDGIPKEEMIQINGRYRNSGVTDKIGLIDSTGKQKWMKPLPECLSDILQIRGNQERAFLLRENNKNMVPSSMEMNILDMQDGRLISCQQLPTPNKKQQLNNLLFELDHEQQPVLAGLITAKNTASVAYDEVLHPFRRSLTQRISFGQLHHGSYKAVYSCRWKDTTATWNLVHLNDTTQLSESLQIDQQDNFFVPCYGFLDTTDNIRFIGPLYGNGRAGLSCYQFVQLQVHPTGSLAIEQTYDTDTVEYVRNLVYLLGTNRIMCSYFKISGRPCIAIGDRSALRIIDYRAQKLVKLIKRNTDGVNRTFFCSREGHISIMETDALGNSNVFIEPID